MQTVKSIDSTECWPSDDAKSAFSAAPIRRDLEDAKLNGEPDANSLGHKSRLGQQADVGSSPNPTHKLNGEFNVDSQSFGKSIGIFTLAIMIAVDHLDS